MTKPQAINPSVSAFFEEFFAEYEPSVDQATTRRIAMVRQDLMDHMDDEGWRVLNPPQTAAFEAEKRARPEGAFARTAGASDLFCILEHYLIPEHAQLGLDQRATQLEVVKALEEKLWREHHISTRTVSKDCRIEFDLALKKGKELVRIARERERFIAV